MSHFSSFNISPRFADCLLREFRHRFNMNLSRLHRPESVDFGHYNHWIVEEIQSLSASVYTDPTKHLFVKWVNGKGFEPTTESFGIVEMSSAVRENYLLEPFSRASDSSASQRAKQYVCASMNTRYEILPVHTKEEMRIFKQLLEDEGHRFDSKQMCRIFNTRANGRDIFYKVPELLEKYKRKVYDKARNAESTLSVSKPEIIQVRKLIKHNRCHKSNLPAPPLRTLEVLNPRSTLPIAPIPIRAQSTSTASFNIPIAPKPGAILPKVEKASRKRPRCQNCSQNDPLTECPGGYNRKYCVANK
jgi:hypothetical protein